MLSKFFALLLTLSLSTFAFAGEDEFGATVIEIKGCSSDGTQAFLRYKVSNFSPWDVDLPEGTERASLIETWAAAQTVFEQEFIKPLSNHSNEEIQSPGFAGELALEPAGQRQGRMDLVILKIKQSLYDQGKYSALSVNYNASSSGVLAGEPCP